MRTAPALLILTSAVMTLAFAPTASAGTRTTAPEPVTAGPIHDISSACSGQNAEVEQAADPSGRFVYEEWMGCRSGLGVATSGDGGLRFGKPVMLPASTGGWDPSVTVAPNGTVYAAFMNQTKPPRRNAPSRHTFPVVDVSTNHGASFRLLAKVKAKQRDNWGDRDFIAAGPDGTLYLTWDYGPSAAKVKFVCPPHGSCSFSSGDLNEVLQRSVDGGRTWSAMSHLSPGFPASGADSGPLVVEPGGRIDVEYQGYQVLNHTTDKLGTANSYFTSSVNGGASWSRPVRLGPSHLTMNTSEWWIDGALAMDGGGDLYATWDTQSGHRDIGWLAFSTDHGAHWSPVTRVTPDTDKATHITQVTGGAAPGTAYVGWLADNSPHGYAEYLRPFSVSHGWLSAPDQISVKFGTATVWPGDTFGLTTLPPGPDGAQPLAVSWGSAVGTARHSDSEIFAARVTAS